MRHTKVTNGHVRLVSKSMSHHDTAVYSCSTACEAWRVADESDMYTVAVVLYSSGARGERSSPRRIESEETLEYPSLIATEELTELLKPVVLCPSNIFRCDTRPAKPLDLCLVDFY